MIGDFDDSLAASMEDAELAQANEVALCWALGYRRVRRGNPSLRVSWVDLACLTHEREEPSELIRL